METIKCKFCGQAIPITATECGHCGYGTPYGVKLAEKELEEARLTEVVADSGSQRGQSIGAPAQVTSLTKRYKDAYLSARVTDGLGRLIKGIGIAIAALLIFGGLMFISTSHPGNTVFALGVAAIFFGSFAGIQVYLLGVLVSAQGQILKASLDTAVNNSPFLTNEHRARIMSLPEP